MTRSLISARRSATASVRTTTSPTAAPSGISRTYMAERVDMINATTRTAIQKALEQDDPVAAVKHVFEVAANQPGEDDRRHRGRARLELGRGRRWQVGRRARLQKLGHSGGPRSATPTTRCRIRSCPGTIRSRRPRAQGSMAWRVQRAGALDRVPVRCSARAGEPDPGELGSYGDAVTLYDNVRAPHTEQPSKLLGGTCSASRRRLSWPRSNDRRDLQPVLAVADAGASALARVLGS